MRAMGRCECLLCVGENAPSALEGEGVVERMKHQRQAACFGDDLAHERDCGCLRAGVLRDIVLAIREDVEPDECGDLAIC